MPRHQLRKNDVRSGRIETERDGHPRDLRLGAIMAEGQTQRVCFACLCSGGHNYTAAEEEVSVAVAASSGLSVSPARQRARRPVLAAALPPIEVAAELQGEWFA